MFDDEPFQLNDIAYLKLSLTRGKCFHNMAKLRNFRFSVTPFSV